VLSSKLEGCEFKQLRVSMPQYTYISSTVLATTIGAQWSPANLLTEKMGNIFAALRTAYVVVLNNTSGLQEAVDLMQYKNRYSSYDSTLKNWLEVEMEGVALATIPLASVPNVKRKQVKYANLFRLKYKIDRTDMSVSQQDPYAGYKPDVAISRPLYASNISKLHTHSLVTINGFVHDTSFSPSTGDTPDTVYIPGGAKSVDKCRMNGIGAISFADISALTKVKIRPIDLVSSADTGRYYEQLTINLNLPVEIPSLVGKSVFLVLGGYILFVNTTSFYQQGDHSFILNLPAISYVDKILEMDHFLDISSLGLTKYPQQANGYDSVELLSNTTITNLFGMTQSFFVIVDTPSLTTTPIVLKSTNEPGCFRTYTEPTYPLFLGYGRVADYWHAKAPSFWKVDVSDAYLRNFLASQGPGLSSGYINARLDPTKPTLSLRGHFLEINGDVA
jgi:hypothetical protein